MLENEGGAARAPEPKDRNVTAVARKLIERSEAGIRKYGVTTERQDLGLADWLRHLQEELLDAAVYVEAALAALEPPPRARCPECGAAEDSAA